MRKPTVAIGMQTDIASDQSDSGIDARYEKMLRRYGAEVITISPTDSLLDITDIIDTADGLMLVSGSTAAGGITNAKGMRERNRGEGMMLRQAVGSHMPVFGICRGMSLLCGDAAVYGQERDNRQPDEQTPNDNRRPRPDSEHVIGIAHGTLLSSLAQADGIDIGRGVGTRDMLPMQEDVEEKTRHVLVQSCDADGTVTSVCRTDLPFGIGVGWHPERAIESPATRVIVVAFVAACASFHVLAITHGMRRSA